jgi:hypothetical protein
MWWRDEVEGNQEWRKRWETILGLLQLPYLSRNAAVWTDSMTDKHSQATDT